MLYVNPDEPGLPEILQDNGPSADASADSDSDTNVRDLFMANWDYGKLSKTGAG